MNKLGLVFAGGGGKGAYQIGVWKYLHEYGIDKYVTGVSGTSVGALNAALFASGSYEAAEKIWKNIQPDQILTPKGISPEWFQKKLASIGLLSALKIIGTGLAFNITSLLLEYLRQSFSFSREGLKALIRDGVDFDFIQAGAIPCYATCLAIPSFQVERFDLRSYCLEDSESILLASSAIPGIFDSISFKGKTYYDGGLPIGGDNVPIAPLYKDGVSIIVVIHLSQTAIVDRSQYPNATIIEIMPQVDLGGSLDGTLDFTSKGAAWRMEQGYRDAERVFKPLIEQLLLGVKNTQLSEAFQRIQRDLDARYTQASATFRENMDAMEDDALSRMVANRKKEKKYS